MVLSCIIKYHKYDVIAFLGNILYRVSFLTGPTLKITSFFGKENVSNFQTGPPLKLLSVNWSPPKSSKCFSVSKMFPTFELVPPLKFLSVNWLPSCWASKTTTELAVGFPHGQAPDQLLNDQLVNFRGGPVLIL